MAVPKTDKCDVLLFRHGKFYPTANKIQNQLKRISLKNEAMSILCLFKLQNWKIKQSKMPHDRTSVFSEYSFRLFRLKKMLELPILAIFATCIFGMIKTSSKKRVKLPIWERENGKREIEIWLKGFLAKMKRNSTRTQKCRLILSVERTKFEEDSELVDNAFVWEYVRFGEDEAEIFDENKRSLEKLKLTEFQKMILKTDSSLKNQLLCRSKINEEAGKWEISADLQSKKISSGGEALIFSERFEDLETAVRVQIFDPFLFTKDFGLDLLTWTIHFQKKGKF
jgi:hypothetical protein